jgi:hypothetical protein
LKIELPKLQVKNEPWLSIANDPLNMDDNWKLKPSSNNQMNFGAMVILILEFVRYYAFLQTL